MCTFHYLGGTLLSDITLTITMHWNGHKGLSIVHFKQVKLGVYPIYSCIQTSLSKVFDGVISRITMYLLYVKLFWHCLVGKSGNLIVTCTAWWSQYKIQFQNLFQYFTYVMHLLLSFLPFWFLWFLQDTF